jgi:PhnB protein
MSKVTPVINMNGKCEDAIHYYEEIFSTKADYILHYSDANSNDWKISLSEEQKKYVYHCEMEIYNQRFMFSDIIDYEITNGNNFFCVIILDTKEEVEKVYKKLEAESTIINPLHSTTYSSAEVNLIDKYGIRWVLMTEGNDK